MANLTLERYQELYARLPQDIRDAYESADIAERIRAIGTKHGLHVDVMGELIDETGLVLLGATHPKDYIRNIAKRMELDAETAKVIAQEVNETIFKPIRESLKAIHRIDQSPDEAAAIHDTQPPQEKPSTAATPSTPKLATIPETPPTPIVEAPVIRPTGIAAAAPMAHPPEPPADHASFAQELREHMARTRQPISTPTSTPPPPAPKPEATPRPIAIQTPTERTTSPTTKPERVLNENTQEPSFGAFTQTTMPQDLADGIRVEEGETLRKHLAVGTPKTPPREPKTITRDTKSTDTQPSSPTQSATPTINTPAQKTITTQQPKESYSADPYREPIE